MIEGWEKDEGEAQACLVVDLPLAFDFGRSWRHSSELDEGFFWRGEGA